MTTAQNYTAHDLSRAEQGLPQFTVSEEVSNFSQHIRHVRQAHMLFMLHTTLVVIIHCILAIKYENLDLLTVAL